MYLENVRKGMPAFQINGTPRELAPIHQYIFKREVEQATYLSKVETCTFPDMTRALL